MNNLLRTLIYGGQVSLTLADTTAIVQEGIDGIIYLWRVRKYLRKPFPLWYL